MSCYVGLMSGTSLDGIDAVLVDFENASGRTLKTAYVPYHPEIKQTLLDLHFSKAGELEQSLLAANQLARLYAEAVNQLLDGTDVTPRAIGCHGQTIRHRPELGYTLQLNNPALLAELTGIDVVADFRNRDIAAGGQGAPLVPAFHQAVFADSDTPRAIINIGGISNITHLSGTNVTGFDCGPGNLLLDAWCERHTGAPYDKDGAWAREGEVSNSLLDKLLSNDFLQLAPPKSTGRDLFNMAWLEHQISATAQAKDVQATLVEFAARCISDAITRHCADVREIYLCGGGTHNGLLVQRLTHHLPHISAASTEKLGIAPDWVEAIAFAWLAKQTMERRPSNIPEVTGAAGPRILGAVYPA
ncbi:anhydro-N-acetylmuramic acid kinase [Novimethylophilus kurashikiensis]|nr:anhydro-N-acetylmuramic acid kinase [Novimethylophilus kurashikiensis]